MTDILFITISNAPILKQEVNGSLLLATKLLEDNFSVKVLRFCEFDSWGKDYPEFIRQITARILEIAPKCISFYTLCATYHVVLRIACEVRKQNPDIHIVLGGPQASVTAQDTLQAMDYIDYICTGEGENTVVPFFRTLLREKEADFHIIPGLFFRENGEVVHNNIPIPLCDLETLPQWNKSLLLPQEGAGEPHITSKHYYMPIDTGRGCPFNCTFCSTSYFWNRTYRLKSPECIIADMQYYHNEFGICSFNMAHDAFTVDQKSVLKVCDYLIEGGMDFSWRCTTRIDCLSEELIDKMKQAGLTWISLGIESGSSRMQKIVKKRLHLDTVKPMVSLLLQKGIKVTLFFMYGFPDETEEDLNETLELMFSLLDMGVTRVSMSFCLFDPATEITVKNYDDLVFDPEKDIVFRNIFGYEEETAMIREHKAIFSFFYHLNTPVRNEYTHLHFLAKLYERFPDILGYIRTAYPGDSLSLYKDFYAANISCFSNIEKAIDMLNDDPETLLLNLLRIVKIPNAKQIHDLVEYKRDLDQFAKQSEKTSLCKTYQFSYTEYRMNLPLALYSNAYSEILMQKKDGKVTAAPQNIQYLPNS